MLSQAPGDEVRDGASRAQGPPAARGAAVGKREGAAGGGARGEEADGPDADGAATGVAAMFSTFSQESAAIEGEVGALEMVRPCAASPPTAAPHGPRMLIPASGRAWAWA